jgi:streptogrisin C
MRPSARAVIVVSFSTAIGCQIDEPDPEARGPDLPDELYVALERDLGQPRPALDRRLAAEAIAAELTPALRDQLGASFGGAWMNEDGSALVVGVTDVARADEVRRAGAEPLLVRWSLRQLEAAIARAPANVDRAIHAWRVDVAGNRIVITSDDPDSPALVGFITELGFDRAAITIEHATDRPRPLYDTRGGDEYIINSNTLCSVGFAVHGGFVTAGHCGHTGSPTAGGNWVAQGTFRGSTFPGSDYAWVELNASWTSHPYVGTSNGQVAVAGSQVAPVGSSICRSGRTTGWRCGVVQAHHVTINYAAGPVYGATQTSACAEGGDSGGSFISGNQAQGVTSGGSGNCSSGGTTFFQPLQPILGAYGLTLKTTGGGGGAKEIVSRFNSKCIDVPSSNFADGAKLQMWDCNGTGAQKWTFTGGTVRAGGKCMDVAWGSTADGASIQLANCSGHPAQQFVLSATGDLVSVLANKCVDIKDWSSASGARLQTWTCAGTANQKWHTR